LPPIEQEGQNKGKKKFEPPVQNKDGTGESQCFGTGESSMIEEFKWLLEDMGPIFWAKDLDST
jgi:hypothetical protein